MKMNRHERRRAAALAGRCEIKRTVKRWWHDKNRRGRKTPNFKSISF